MRFLAAAVASMALIGSTVAAPIKYQLDIAGDNTFSVYYSQHDSSTVSTLKAVGSSTTIETGWSTPSKYTNLYLDTGDVLAVHVQNILAGPNDGSKKVDGNPSAIVARLTPIDEISGLPITEGPNAKTIVTDNKWNCAYRTETIAGHNTFEPERYFPSSYGSATYRATAWAAATFTNPNLGGGVLSEYSQVGSTQFTPAVPLSSLYNSNNIWYSTVVDNFPGTNIFNAIPQSNNPDSPDPWWIYATSQLNSNDPLVHHGWCRLRIGSPTGFAPPGGNGDPVFSGFQGQEFQFHGLPDEHFNLISSPQVQLNAHFVYLSAGKCDYTDTACWTHPGTYMDVMGFSIGETRVKVVAGSHADGLRVWVNDAEVPRNTVIPSLAGNVTSTLRYSRSGKVHIHTDLIDYTVINSDMFMNLQAAMKSSQLLSVGAHKHTVTDSNICHTNTETHNHQLIESTVSKKYPMTTQLHGLIGQTWRNVKVCGRDWMGTVQDYVTESLFGTTYHYNYFGKSA